MRRLALVLSLIIVTGFAACGSGEDPANDLGTPDAVQDTGSDEGQDLPPIEDVATDTGTDNAWMDMHLPDMVEDIPEGPFYAREDGDLVTVTDGRLTVVLDLMKGTFNIGFNPGLDGIINGHSEAWVKSVEGMSVVSSLNPSQRAAWQAQQMNDGLDDGVTIAMETVPSGSIGGLRTFISLHRNTPAVTVKTMLVLPMREGFLITRLLPVVTRGSEGAGMLLGPGTASARIITGGHEIAYDGNAESLNVTEAVETLNAPGYLSDNATLICTKHGKCLLSGFLNVVRGFGGVAVATDPLSAFAVGEDAALSLYELRSTMVQGAMLSPSRVITSEMAYLDFTEEPEAALERFGTAMATFNAIPALKKAPAIFTARVAAGGLSSTQVVDKIPDSGEGFDVFLVGRGWWDKEKNTDTARFPASGGKNAMKWIAEQTEGASLIPGIALDPFVFENDSTFAATHADWLVAPGELGVVRLGLGNNSSILDLTNDTARAWAVSYIETAVKDWGYGYIRIHNADVACMGAPGATEGMTGVEGLRKLLTEVRTAVGPDVQIELAEGGMLGMGLIDAAGVTNESYKSWDAPASKVDGTLQMGAMALARRAWMDGRLFNLVAGTAFDFSAGSEPAAGDWLGLHLWGVAGALPEAGEANAGAGLLAELFANPFSGARSPDFADLRIPETWYASTERDGVTSHLAAFFRFDGNMDLQTLAATNGMRTRTLDLPAAEGNWLAMDTADGQMIKIEGACMNPDGATFAIENGPSASRAIVMRSITPGAPTFMGMVPSIAGGDGYITQLTSDAGSTTVTFDTFARMNTRVVFATPIANSPTISVEGATEVDQGVSTTDCDDMKTVWIEFTPTADSVTVTASI